MEMPQNLDSNVSAQNLQALQPTMPQAEMKINLINPLGDVVTMPKEYAQEALAQGYEPASPEQVNEQIKQEKFGTPIEQLKTGLEGAASAATFGISTGLERAFGVNPEDIRARAEVNPLIHGTGEAVGIIGSALLIPGGGAAGAMEAAGAATAAKLIPGAAAGYETARAVQLARETGVGLEAAQTALKVAKNAQPALVKIGTAAADQAVQFAVMSAGDEVSKMFMSTPGQTLGTAMSDIGVGALIGGVTGGAIGSISPLWKATLGPKTENFLNKLKNAGDGVSIPISQDLESVLKNAPPEIRAGMSLDPEARTYFQTLIESGIPAGDALRETRDKFQNTVRENLSNVFKIGEGQTPFEAGEKAKESILKKADELHQGVRAKYNEIADATTIQIPDEQRLKFYDSLIEQGQNFGAAGAPSEEIFKIYAERALAQDSIGQMDKLVTEIGSAQNVAYRAGDFEKSKALSQIKESIRDFQENQISSQALQLAKATGDENMILAAELLKDQRVEARKSYAEFMKQVGDIASIGKLGKVKSFSQLQDALEKVPAAKFAEKLFDKKNIEGLNYLKQNFPEVFDNLIVQRKTDIFESAMKTGDLQHNKILNLVNALPKEVQNLMFMPEEMQIIKSSGEILRETNKRMNPSGTARAIDTLWGHLGGGVGSLVATLTGNNPIVGLLLGEATQFVGRNVPDAIKLSLLKYLGSSGEVSAPGFKAMVDYAHAVYQGEKVLTKATKEIFSTGPATVFRSFEQNDRARQRLQDRIDELSKDPEQLMDTGGDAHVYLPDHALEMSKTASNTINYLNNLKPKQVKNSPLDSRPVINSTEMGRYTRALDIANQPMIVMKNIKDGSITSNDLTDLKSMMPGVYQSIYAKITDELVNHVDAEEPLPYATKLGISAFMGQALETSLQPQSIYAAQNLIAPQQQQGQTIPGQRQKHSFTALNKMPGMYQTPQQKRSAEKVT